MLGYDHDSFWDQTPRTLWLTFSAYNERQIKEHNERAWLAFHSGAVARTNKRIKLRDLQIRQQTAPQAMEEQIAGLVNWVKATGGKVIYKEKKDG